MSFVSVIANSEFITAVSDGQVTRDGIEIQNDFKKIKKIHPDQFIAFSGAKELCESLANHIEYNNERHDMRTIAEDLSTFIQRYDYENVTLQFIVGGLNFDDNIEFFTMNNDPNESLISYVPQSTESLQYAFLNKGELEDEINLESTLVKHLREIGFNTPNKCIRVQKKLNNDVADVDETVNKITFDLIIRK